jgi:hypothetical protein
VLLPIAAAIAAATFAAITPPPLPPAPDCLLPLLVMPLPNSPGLLALGPGSGFPLAVVLFATARAPFSAS